MAQRIMLKKDEKVKAIYNMMLNKSNVEEFIDLFIKNYPSDWERIKKRWEEHEKKNKGRKHPMPKPKQYVKNLYNTYIKKINGDL